MLLTCSCEIYNNYDNIFLCFVLDELRSQSTRYMSTYRYLSLYDMCWALYPIIPVYVNILIFFNVFRCLISVELCNRSYQYTSAYTCPCLISVELCNRSYQYTSAYTCPCLISIELCSRSPHYMSTYKYPEFIDLPNRTTLVYRCNCRTKVEQRH
jgi:hypothetical protein